MHLKTLLAIFTFVCLGVLFTSASSFTQDDMVVRFDNSITKSGEYVGVSDDGKVVVLVVKTHSQRRGFDAKVTGEMIFGGQSHSVSGTVVGTAAGAVYYPVFGSQLNAVAGFTESSGGDYELSGSRSDIYAHGTADGKITSFFHGTGFYEWNEEARCYENNEGFDKFKFWSNGDGTYRYEHTCESWGGGGGTHSSGTASPGG